MTKWQAGYYHQNGQEIVWKSLDAKSLRNAMRLADEWVETTFRDDCLPMSMVVVAQETSEFVSALRYLDEIEWVSSGKGIGVGLKHKMATD